MKASHRFHLLKVAFVLFHLLFWLTAVYAWSCPTKECGEIPFSTEVIAYEKVDDCYQVTLEVTHNGQAKYELSHVNFYFSCGSIENYSNTEGWKMETVYRNHKAVGIKVDDITNFGKDEEFTSFQVEFTYCPYSSEDTNCKDNNYCQPKALYKAGQCIYIENLDTDDDASDDAPETPALKYDVNATSPTCSGNDGMIEITITEGTDPVTIEWSNGASGNLLENLSAGNYSFTIKDGAGNEIADEIILEATDGIMIENIVSKPTCMGVENGSISLSITGGTAPYTYAWNTGSTEQNLVNLASGYYAVTVTDANECKSEATFTLYNEKSLSVETAVTQPSCQDGTLGSISLTPANGTEPYIYLWSNGMTESSISDLKDGIYDITITDQIGCEYRRRIPIVTAVGFDVTLTPIKTNCFNDPIGAIDLTVTGGTAPFTYVWSNSATTEDLDGLVAGSYTVTVTDALGCHKTVSATVLKNELKINYDAITLPTCSDSNDGAIDISVTNGTGPYTYSWSTGAITEDIDNLSGGKYNLTVADAAGCTLVKSINLPAAGAIQISHEVVQDICTGEQSIIVSAAGGNPDYTYEWTDGNTVNKLINVSPGDYTVVVTDANGCSASQSITVTEFSANTACAIADLTTEIACGSIDNGMQSAITDADYYKWSVSSSDGSWEVTSSTDQSLIQFNAGSAGSSATFSLTLGYEGGCEISCEKIIEVCVDNNDPDNPNDNPDSDDPTNDDPNNDDPTDGDDGSSGDPDLPGGGSGSEPNGDKECDECFFTSPVSITRTYGGYQFTFEVSHGDCNYDLSHLTIEIPECFKIIDYSNSMNWKMGVVKNDPTTGLTGIKIDDIPSFGKDGTSSFEISLKLTSYDHECADDLACFAPVIAYKAATCVYEEITQSECLEDEDAEDEVNTYPNPTCDHIKVYKRNWDRNSSYSADLLDSHGEKIKSFHFKKGFAKDFDIDLSSCKEGLYLLQLKSSSGDCSIHRVIKN